MQLADEKAQKGKWRGEIVEQADDTRVNGGQGCTLTAEYSGFLPVIRKEYRQESQQRQEGADFINQIDAGMVRQQA